jgi:GT2 family glycosyltransferase
MIGATLSSSDYVPQLSVIILNWNGKQLLADCLNALSKQTFDNFEVVLVDNGSDDGSVVFIKTEYPWVKLIELPQNLGFAGGNNRGLDACQGEYIVTLNNDTKVEPNFLFELVKTADGDGKIGMVAAKMLNFYDMSRIDSVGIRVAKNGLGYNIGFGEQDCGQYDESVEVFGPCAGAALYARSMLEETGFFDPDFFAYYEDLDLAWRGRLAGWSCRTAPKALVYHVHSATGGKGSSFKIFQIHRNKWYAILKNWPPGLLWRRLPGLLLIDFAALALALFCGRGISAFKARIAVLRNLPKLFAKRNEVQRKRTLPPKDLDGLFSPAESVFRTLMRRVGER